MIFNELTDEMKLYWVIHEMEYLKHIPKAIKVRHPIVSHLVYHPEHRELLTYPELTHSHIFLINNVDSSSEIDAYFDVLENLCYEYTEIKYTHCGMKSLYRAAKKIAAKVLDCGVRL